jgi:CheY-like chemotaxis protein
VHQVILNLAINARDAMPNGGALRVSLSSMAESDVQNLPGALALGGQLACLVVTDTGAGMPPEVQARVFEPFYTTKARGEGTGLGLSIVHGVIREHGGHIEVQSELGKGTTFTVFLPCIPAGEAAQQAAPATITPTGKGELLLLAEDDQHVLGMIASTLDSLGYKVVLASDGVSVLEMAAHHGEDIRLLILDVDLPEKSGPDCVKALRERGLNTPAIMITGNVDFDAAVLDNKTALLRKPFGMPELASTVSDALGRAPGQEALS